MVKQTRERAADTIYIYVYICVQMYDKTLMAVIEIEWPLSQIKACLRLFNVQRF
jgi:hypothetical protein